MTQSTYPGGTEKPPGSLIYRGAEADILQGTWVGRPAIFKVRKPLPYRLPELDSGIRRQRTAHEATIMHSARKAGVQVPWLYRVDMPGTTLVMEHVYGERLKERVGDSAESSRLFRALGQDVARLHAAGITHGDITTANVIVRRKELVLIDFGLASRSSRLEDRAVDLRLIKETLVGAHARVATRAFEALLEGYSVEAGGREAEAAVTQLRSIERRGRYARVT